MISYQQGETSQSKAYTYESETTQQNTCIETESCILVDVDTIVITIKDIEGNIIINELDMIHDDIGVYSFNYNIASNASIGLWKIIIKATLNSIISIKNDSFRVVP